jgi:hypothetical protein
MMEEVLRGMGKRRLLVPMPVAVIRLVAATAEPSACRSRGDGTSCASQARQHLRGRCRADRIRLRAAADGGGLTHLRRKPTDQ